MQTTSIFAKPFDPPPTYQLVGDLRLNPLNAKPMSARVYLEKFAKKVGDYALVNNSNTSDINLDRPHKLSIVYITEQTKFDNNGKVSGPVFTSQIDVEFRRRIKANHEEVLNTFQRFLNEVIERIFWMEENNLIKDSILPLLVGKIHTASGLIDNVPDATNGLMLKHLVDQEILFIKQLGEIPPVSKKLNQLFKLPNEFVWVKESIGGEDYLVTKAPLKNSHVDEMLKTFTDIAVLENNAVIKIPLEDTQDTKFAISYGALLESEVQNMLDDYVEFTQMKEMLDIEPGFSDSDIEFLLLDDYKVESNVKLAIETGKVEELIKVYTKLVGFEKTINVLFPVIDKHQVEPIIKSQQAGEVLNYIQELEKSVTIENMMIPYEKLFRYTILADDKKLSDLAFSILATRQKPTTFDTHFHDVKDGYNGLVKIAYQFRMDHSSYNTEAGLSDMSRSVAIHSQTFFSQTSPYSQFSDHIYDKHASMLGTPKESVNIREINEAAKAKNITLVVNRSNQARDVKPGRFRLGYNTLVQPPGYGIVYLRKNEAIPRGELLNEYPLAHLYQFLNTELSSSSFDNEQDTFALEGENKIDNVVDYLGIIREIMIEMELQIKHNEIAAYQMQLNDFLGLPKDTDYYRISGVENSSYLLANNGLQKTEFLKRIEIDLDLKSLVDCGAINLRINENDNNMFQIMINLQKDSSITNVLLKRNAEQLNELEVDGFLAKISSRQTSVEVIGKVVNSYLKKHRLDKLPELIFTKLEKAWPDNTAAIKLLIAEEILSFIRRKSELSLTNKLPYYEMILKYALDVKYDQKASSQDYQYADKFTDLAFNFIANGNEGMIYTNVGISADDLIGLAHQYYERSKELEKHARNLPNSVATPSDHAEPDSRASKRGKTEETTNNPGKEEETIEDLENRYSKRRKTSNFGG